MKLSVLQKEQYEEFKHLFYDVFTNDPWFDKWENEKQLDQYLNELIFNNNSLTLALWDEEGKIIGGSMGYIYSWWQGREYYIKEFFISTEKQNKGIGTYFVEEVNKYLKTKDIKFISLATDKGTPAYGFYKKNKFEELKNNVFLYKEVK